MFSAEVDDKGIDFILRIDGNPPCYYDVQGQDRSIQEHLCVHAQGQFRLAPNLLLALVILDAGSEPEMYLIPASALDLQPERTGVLAARLSRVLGDLLRRVGPRQLTSSRAARQMSIVAGSR